MHLYDVPVDRFQLSSYSLLNEGASFSRFFPSPMTNKGTGKNYGLELTMEKFFSHSYFMMLTASWYDSRYKGSDGIERNTSFNGHYAANFLGGKEFTFGEKKNTTWSTGFKLTQAGGQRYTPVDTTLSHLTGEIVEKDKERNTLQFRDYFRFDFRIGIKINAKKLTHALTFDLVNILNTKNILSLTYVFDPSQPASNPIKEQYQLGFLPLFSYKIDF